MQDTLFRDDKTNKTTKRSGSLVENDSWNKKMHRRTTRHTKIQTWVNWINLDSKTIFYIFVFCVDAVSPLQVIVSISLVSGNK